MLGDAFHDPLGHRRHLARRVVMEVEFVGADAFKLQLRRRRSRIFHTDDRVDRILDIDEQIG